MKFNAKKAEHDYITDNSMSYRKLAEKYEVSKATICRYATKNNWAEKKKQYETKLVQTATEKTLEKEADKLSTLRTATDTAIDVVDRFITEFAEQTEGDGWKYKNFKDCVTMLKELTALQRNLHGILTKQEEIALNTDSGETGETGIVFIPALAPEETENVVIEGETDV